ncbi:MAG: hypothetical protein OEY20_10090 [Gemmatimonadota bacterium]|nr:hypothetical protein [Gemmatimonadota bacterium]MDH5197590.1 hypothetical protein [Gemmatimonadota bacterium]
MRPSTIAVRRPLAGLVLLLQLTALGVWLPHVRGDARVSAGAHVEAAGTSDCPAVHDESRCALCQSMTVRFAVPLAGTPRLPLGMIVGEGAVADESCPGEAALLAHRPRAPPRSPV